MENTQTFTLLSHEQFNKKVEIEAAHLMHFNNLDKATADKVAFEIISEKFTTSQAMAQ
jgi:hypothetical protein